MAVHETENLAELNEFITKYLLHGIVGIICLIIFILVILQCKRSKSSKTIDGNRKVCGKQNNHGESPVELQDGNQPLYETIPESIGAVQFYQPLTDNYDEINEQLLIPIP